MATMKKFRVVLDITINEDYSNEPKEWITDDIEMDEDGEEIALVSQELVEEWETDDDDDDDDDDDEEEASCEFDDGDRVKCIASTRDLIDSCAHVGDPISAARIAGHEGKVIDTDPGSAPEVRVEFDNGEVCWVCEEQLARVIEVE